MSYSYLGHSFEHRKSIILKTTTTYSILWKPNLLFWEINKARAITQKVSNLLIPLFSVHRKGPFCLIFVIAKNWAVVSQLQKMKECLISSPLFPFIYLILNMAVWLIVLLAFSGQTKTTKGRWKSLCWRKITTFLNFFVKHYFVWLHGFSPHRNWILLGTFSMSATLTGKSLPQETRLPKE
jgi:hypothetical protein